MKNTKTFIKKVIAYRSAISGKFITKSAAVRHPRTTIRETIKKK